MPRDTTRERNLRVVHVSFHSNADLRDGDALLRAYPTLVQVPTALVRLGLDVAVVQAAVRDETLSRAGVAYHLVRDARGTPKQIGAGLRVHRVPRRVIARVVSLAPDVVHLHGFLLPRATRALVRRLNRIPVVVHDHGSMPPTGWRRRIWRWAYRGVAGMIFTSRDQAAPFIDAGVLRRDMPIFEILPGSSVFTPGDRDAERARTGIAGAPCLLWSSHLDANKDPLTALDAFERAAARLPYARLWCCYQRAPLLEEVRRRVAESPILYDRVTLLGTRSHADMEHLFRAADFFVQTSHREASGFSLLEALSCGATPLVTDIPATRKIVGKAGSLTPVGDADALADAIVRWSECDRGALRRAARARFDAALSLDVVARELRVAYDALNATAS